MGTQHYPTTSKIILTAYAELIVTQSVPHIDLYLIFTFYCFILWSEYWILVTLPQNISLSSSLSWILAANNNTPKVTDILADQENFAHSVEGKQVEGGNVQCLDMKAMNTTSKESFAQNPKSAQVRGGWIYADSNYPDDHKYLLVQHTSKDHTEGK